MGNVFIKSEPTSTDAESPENPTPNAEQRQNMMYMACKCVAQRNFLRNLQWAERQDYLMPRYLSNKRNRRTRSYLVDWLVERSIVNKLETETLHLSVSYVDRFLMMKTSSKHKVVGAAALSMAAKYEEGRCGLNFHKNDVYSKKEVKHLMAIMRRTLDWELKTPTACGFINAIAELCKWPDKLRYLALYIAELGLMIGGAFMRLLPSRMASASIALARYTLGMEMWTQQLEEITTHKLQVIRAVIRKLSNAHKTAKGLEKQSVRVKYIGKKYQDVAMIEAIDLRSAYFNKLCLEHANRPLRTEITICFCKE